MKEMSSIEKAKDEVSRIENVIEILKKVEESRKDVLQLDVVKKLREEFKDSTLNQEDREAIINTNDFIVRVLSVSKTPVSLDMMSLLIRFTGDSFDKSRRITMNGELVNLINKGTIDLNLDRSFGLHRQTED